MSDAPLRAPRGFNASFNARLDAIDEALREIDAKRPVGTPNPRLAEVIMQALALDKGADPDPWCWADDAVAVMMKALRDAGYIVVRKPK